MRFPRGALAIQHLLSQRRISMATQIPTLPEVERISPSVIRILGGNPSKFTLQGDLAPIVITTASNLICLRHKHIPFRNRSQSPSHRHGRRSHLLATPPRERLVLRTQHNLARLAHPLAPRPRWRGQRPSRALSGCDHPQKHPRSRPGTHS